MRKSIIFCLLFFTLFCGNISNISASDYSEISVSNEDIDLVIRLTHFETDGEPLLCKCAFAAVVFNRVKSEYFPSDVHGVIYYEGAFDSVKRRDFTAELSKGETADDELAVRYVLEKGIDPICGALFVMKKDDVHLWELREKFRIGDFIFGDIP